VKYEYGPTGAAENGAGRIVRVVDDAGEETRGYGKLGELKRTTRVLRPLKPLDPPLAFATMFEFDAYGRMLSITYPDQERVTYSYDRGGLLRSATGDRSATPYYPGATEEYVRYVAYDEFGQRRVARLGNGALTTYDYYDETHRLKQIKTTAAGRLIQSLSFGYDLVGNVVGEANGLGPSTDERSGGVRYAYGYDSLDRLKHALGNADARPGVTDEFEAKYEYSDVHDMLRNSQVHKVTTVTAAGTDVAFPPHTNHDYSYAYGNAGKPHQASMIGDTVLTYDLNGNTASECRDHLDPTCSVNRDHFREYRWTEDNRLAVVVQGGGSNWTRFLYDAAGERIVKFGRGGASITIGQFFSMKGRTAATKHVFGGTTRLASKLLPAGMWQLPTPSATGAVVVNASGGPTVVNNDNGCVPSDYQPQKCPIDPDGNPIVPPRFDDTKVRPETYYYHSDHLGSTSWVTDQNGRVHEHVDYFPYGEIWREPKSDRSGAGVNGQRFLFSGKELDEETGLYAFGARYYDPRRARWTSADPLLDKYLTARGPAGGSNKPVNFAVYAYVHHNPLVLVDPDGLRPLTPGEVELLRTIYHDKIDYKKVDVHAGTEGRFIANFPHMIGPLSRSRTTSTSRRTSTRRTSPRRTSATSPGSSTRWGTSGTTRPTPSTRRSRRP
jgi:RHS repeat-associated protein